MGFPPGSKKNGRQELEGLKYENQPWRHGEESMDPFHDETFSYTQDLALKLAATGGREMHHTDRNTLRCVKRFHPSVENT